MRGGGCRCADAPLLCRARPRTISGRAAADAGALPGSLPLVHVVAPPLPVAPKLLARRRARASRACAGANASVRAASASELRAAVVCLINRFRSRGGLPPLREQGQLDWAAQGHTDQMVAEDYFGHDGAGGSNPAVRISASGFSWGAYGEAISTGFRSPRGVVRGWLRSLDHCQILLSPQYRYIGVGVNPREVAGFATFPGTWTADLALPLGEAAPSGSWGLADGCPY